MEWLGKLRAAKVNPVPALVGIWAVSLIIGFCVVNGYDLQAARTGPPVQNWPVTTSLRAVPGIPTLVMALHPRCPCSELSVTELQNVLAREHMRINAHLLVYQPHGYPVDWAMTNLVRRAQTIKGVDVLFDYGGAELTRFHARASGELWFYDGAGKLRFRGGITGGRSHSGNNSGIASLTSLLGGGLPLTEQAPVFGCAIGGEDRIAGQ